MLIGQYEHSLDSKGRMTLPASFAGQLASGLVLTRGLTEPCIYLFPRAEFQQLSDRMRALPLSNRKARIFRRRLFGMAAELEPDRQRRVLIPQWLRDHAAISDRVVIAGMDIYAELWSPAAWREQEAMLEAELVDDDLFADLGV